ncbi:MAG: universal stress protein [Desulfotignum sp.]|nr:universal stress protein [Desulfotignum sp.]
MFKKILYPTDFSDVSKKALAYIKQLNPAGAEQVIIMRIINENKLERFSEGAAWVGMDAEEFREQTYQRLTEEANEQIKTIETELKEAGFDTKTMVERGDPYSKILDVAEKEDVSIIILGSHGRSNLSSVLLGSVSDHIIRHARQPVLVIKRDS